MHTHLGLPCLLGELPLLSSVISLIPRNFLCSKVHSVWCWYNHSCFLLISVCMECFGVCWVSFLWKLRFSWFFACQLNLDFITDILNIMSGDSESHLKPVEYVDIFVSSGISPVGPGHSFQPVFYRLSNPHSAIQIPPACDPPCNSEPGLAVYPQSVLRVSGMVLQGQTQTHAAGGWTQHFLHSGMGLLPKPLPLHGLPRPVQFPGALQSSSQTPLCCTLLATVPESKAAQWNRVVSLKGAGAYQRAEVLTYHYW